MLFGGYVILKPLYFLPTCTCIYIQVCQIFFFFFFFKFLAVLGFCCCAQAFFSCGEWGLLSSRDVQASHCGHFFCCRAWALECGLSSCGTWAYSLPSMWDLPGPGIKPVSPALAGIFLSTGPPGKSHMTLLPYRI